jgi:hypothetical protein
LITITTLSHRRRTFLTSNTEIKMARSKSKTTTAAKYGCNKKTRKGKAEKAKVELMREAPYVKDTAPYKEANLALINIKTPNDSDVICGRGGGSNHHKGNETFRRIVKEKKGGYVETDGRTPKAGIAWTVVQWIRYKQNPPGRFLEKNENGTWTEVGDKKAQVKTSQALREKNSNRTKKHRHSEKPKNNCLVSKMTEEGVAKKTTLEPGLKASASFLAVASATKTLDTPISLDRQGREHSLMIGSGDDLSYTDVLIDQSELNKLFEQEDCYYSFFNSLPDQPQQGASPSISKRSTSNVNENQETKRNCKLPCIFGKKTSDPKVMGVVVNPFCNLDSGTILQPKEHLLFDDGEREISSMTDVSAYCFLRGDSFDLLSPTGVFWVPSPREKNKSYDGSRNELEFHVSEPLKHEQLDTFFAGTNPQDSDSPDHSRQKQVIDTHNVFEQ